MDDILKGIKCCMCSDRDPVDGSEFFAVTDLSNNDVRIIRLCVGCQVQAFQFLTGLSRFAIQGYR